MLKLDHNPIGSEGINALIKGIHFNQFLKIMSFTYCRLDFNCSRAIFELLIYSKSKVEELYLQGNNFRNEGFIQIMEGVAANKSLKKLSLADNQVNEDKAVLEQIKLTMTRNKNLCKYDFQFNDFKDEGKSFYFVLTSDIQQLSSLLPCLAQKRKAR